MAASGAKSQQMKPTAVEELKRVNIRTDRDIVCADPNFVTTNTSVDAETFDRLKWPVLQKCLAVPISGNALLQQATSELICYSTGCQQIDDLVDGGICSHEVTEIFGAPASGKTQFCLALSASAALTQQARVLYIDASNSFSAKQLDFFLPQASQQNRAAALERVRCVRVMEIYGLLAQLDHLHSSLAKAVTAALRPVDILIVDSIASLITPILHGNTGYGLMGNVSRILKYLAAEYGLAVVITNYCTSGNRAALGAAWTFVPSVQLAIIDLASNDGSCKRIEVRRSTRTSTGQFVGFQICRCGLIALR